MNFSGIFLRAFAYEKTGIENVKLRRDKNKQGV
jgi:hypothetical protein